MVPPATYVPRMTTDKPVPETDADGRYAVIETGSGETMIYDRDNPDAWVQSDHAVDVGT
ncbi:TrkA, K+ transport system, NAD-binding component [Halapricum desulfuricans]|uniref:TrkA, K+ transport system, NAD-binding component n=1 Tax=Halapricum desulfuricans TaxID=2841257 RepID=A0A897NQ69_9EURY|nr:TrkA, K+ transport system, NAD-binding component [Halapricum desulfuricans]